MTSEDQSMSGRRDSTDASPNPESPPATLHGRPQTDGKAFANTPTPPGASVYPPAAAVSSALNPRSCITCRRRKVRCDKHMPCSNCRRAQTSCIFPAPGRAPRRPRPKDPNAPPKQQSSEREIELMKRLRKLEGIVEDLSGQIELEAARHSSVDGHSPDAAGDGDNHALARTDTSGSLGRGSPSTSSGTGRTNSGPGCQTQPQRADSAVLEKSRTTMNKDFGRLVLNDNGSSRYVSSGFWSKVNDEINEIRAATQNITDEDSDQSDAESTPESLNEKSLDHQSFILGYRSSDVDLRPLHPLPSQIPFMWEIYKENVDPCVKVLHVPSMDKLIRETRADLDKLTPSAEALMFSMYYATVTSMEVDEVSRALGAEKAVLLNQYRFGVEQALAKANFLTDPDLTTCQAFVIFLMLVRRHDKFRFAWTLTGLAVRICQAIGLHRDGTKFPHLKPFEIEMRRRLFWSLAMLDLRSAEEQGTECIIAEGSFDTQLPLNINDTDISPESTEFPKARESATDLTFCLIRFEICSFGRRMHQESARVCPDMTREEHLKALEEREAMLLNVYKDLESKYLRDSSAEENPLYWVSANVSRLIVAKMVTIIYQPILFALPVDRLSCRLRQRLFIAAVEIFEYNHILSTDPRCKQWRWLFRTYAQWHAVAYLLLEVCNRPWSATSERAWTALNAVFSGPNNLALERMSTHTAVWLPFKKLFHRAKKHRDAELARLRGDPATAEQLYQSNLKRDPPSTFSALPTSIKCSIAQDRWRKLVHLPSTPPISGCGPYEEVYPFPGLSRTSAGSIAAGHAAIRAADEQRADEIVEAAIANPTFTPTQIMPLVFPSRQSGMDTMSVARDITFGFASVDIPAPDHNVLNSPDPAAAPLPDDDYPPVWLWNTRHVPEPDEPANAALGGEDGDVNMDEGLEGFDWQNWQESIRGYEMETGGASNGVNGVWSLWH